MSRLTGLGVAEPLDGARRALAALWLAILMPSLATSIANASLPALAQAFAAPFQAVQWVVLGYLLSVTVLVAAVGRLGDMVGRRRLLLAGIATFAGASLLCGLAPTLALLIAARIAQGVGAAIMMALAMTFIGDVVPPARRGSAIGLMGTMSAIGTTLGPALGGFLIAWWDVRAIFLINVPLAILTLIFAWRTLPADGEAVAPSRTRFDWAGTALLIVTLTAYALAMTIGRGHFGAVDVALLVAALVAGAAFLIVEARTASPLIRLGLFSNARLSAGLAGNTLITTVMMATLIVGPFYLGGALGQSAAIVGLVLATGPLVAALTGVPAGRLVDRFGSEGVGTVGLAMLAAGACALAVLPVSLGTIGYVVPIATMTAGYGLFQAGNSTAILAAAGAAERGAGSGMLGLARNLGLVTGASLMGALFALGTGGNGVAAATPGAIAAGLHLTFAAGAGLVFAALAIDLLSRRRTRRGNVAAGPPGFAR